MKQKLMQWVLAATLVCGTCVFTSCSKDKDDPAPTPVPEEQKVDPQPEPQPEPEPVPVKKNKDVFVEHTRTMTKQLAENLNFTSWNTANEFNTYFNTYVLNNPEFNKAILAAFVQKVMLSVKPVEEGSPLAAAGFTSFGTVDLTNFNYRFTMNENNAGFNIEEAEDFEVLLNGFNPMSEQMENGIYKVNLKVGGTTMTRVLPMPNVDGMAMVILLGSEFEFAMSSKISGSWNDDFSGIMHYVLPDGETDNSKGFTADAVINSNILPGTVGELGDKSQLEISISSDRVNGHATGQATWSQNGMKVLDLSVKESGEKMGAISNLDLSQFSSSASIFELIGSILGTRSIDEAKLTLLDDMTTTFSISNLKQLLEIEGDYRHDGRNYASKEAIEEYTKKMNELVKAELYCKGLNQTIPMTLLTAPVGVDYWTVYGFKFSDEEDYISMLSLLDRKTFAYMLNIMDHAVDPMEQSIIVVRQLLQYVQSLLGTFIQG